MFRFLIRTFLKGASVLIPILVSVWVLYAVVRAVEQAARKMLSALGLEFYFPGLGVLLTLGLMLGFGLLMYPWLTRKIVDWLERQLRRIPIFKTVYSPLKDMMSMMSGDISEKLGKPVFVKLPNSDVETLGFITRRPSDADSQLPDGCLLVYVQMSYQLGGFTFIVPENTVRDSGLSVEEGIRWALTAGLSTTKPDPKAS